MAEITALFGVSANPNPNEAVISCLERFLEEARRGEVIGVALAMVRPSRDITTGWTCGSAPLSMMLAAASGLHGRILREWVEIATETEGDA